MTAFGRGSVRTFLLTGLSAVAMTCAASLAFADPPAAGPSVPIAAEFRFSAFA